MRVHVQCTQKNHGPAGSRTRGRSASRRFPSYLGSCLDSVRIYNRRRRRRYRRCTNSQGLSVTCPCFPARFARQLLLPHPPPQPVSLSLATLCHSMISLHQTKRFRERGGWKAKAAVAALTRKPRNKPASPGLAWLENGIHPKAPVPRPPRDTTPNGDPPSPSSSAPCACDLIGCSRFYGSLRRPGKSTSAARLREGLSGCLSGTLAPSECLPPNASPPKIPLC